MTGTVRGAPIRVVLVDDQELIRTGFRMVLNAQPDLQVVGEADDGDTALEVLARTPADVVLMDVRMPRMDGVEATRRLRSDDRHDGDRTGSRREDGGAQAPKVLVLTTFDLDEYAWQALRAGASGFLLKDAALNDLVSAIHHVHAGDAVVAPSTTRRLLEHFTGGDPAVPAATAGPPHPPSGTRLEDLTPREHDVLLLVAAGLSNAEIAAELVLSEGTVKTHVGRILTKLHLRDRVQAVVLAYESGLVSARRAGPGPAR